MNDIKNAKDSIKDDYMKKSYARGISIGLKNDDINLNKIVIKLYTIDLDLAKKDYGNNMLYNGNIFEFDYVQIIAFYTKN